MTAAAIQLLAALLLPWLTLVALLLRPRALWIRWSLPATPAVALLLAVLAPNAALQWSGLLLGSEFAIDDSNRPFLIATAVGWLAAAILAVPFIAQTARASRFLTCFLLAMAGNVALVLSQDAVTFYTAFAVMSLAAYGLVNHDGTQTSVFAGRVYIALAIAGELLLFAALLAVAAASPDLGFPLAFETPLPGWAIACIVLGFGIKAGLLPLHVGLPLSYAAAPHPAGVALAGAMLNAGLLGFWHWLPLGATSMPVWGTILAAVGLVGVFYGSVCGALQRDPRALLGYSSISQVGLMVLFLSVGFTLPQYWPVIGSLMLLFVLHHSLAKTAAFCLADGMPSTNLPRAIRIALPALPAIALVGVPLTTGFGAKASLKEMLSLPVSGLEQVVPLLAVASVGTAVLMARWVQLVFDVSGPRRHGRSAALIAIVIMAASFALPWVATDGSADLAPKEIWSAVWPAIAGLILAGILRQAQNAGWVGYIPVGDVARPATRLVFLASMSIRKVNEKLAMNWRYGAEIAGRLWRIWFDRDAGIFSTRAGRTASEATLVVFVAVLAVLTITLTVF